VVDLLEKVTAAPDGRAVDLGCGTGRYTPLLHRRVRARVTVGVDSSASMLADSDTHAGDGVRFVEGDLVELATSDGPWDVMFANASLHWVPAHEELLPRLTACLSTGGQLAFQVPANFDHPSHVLADEIGVSYGLEPMDRAVRALSPARYAEILWSCGLRDLDVSLRVYGVEMERTDEVVDWVSGTLLTRFEAALEPADFARFADEYRRRLLAELGDPEGRMPYYYAFPRILCHGRRP
jgi:trans-aconitate 2-methyltransferase